MSRVNPLLLGAWRGLVGSAESTHRQLGYLLLQSAALLVWWPWSDMAVVLESGSPPRALMAVVTALGVCVAFDGVRAGAEASLLPGQHPLREWLAGTPLSPGRILRGFVAGQMLQVLHLLVLSSPLLMLAFAVSASDWSALGRALGSVLLLAAFYRLCGTLVYLLGGEATQETLVTLRALVLVSYAVVGFLLPAASHPRLTYALLIEGHTMALALGGLPGDTVFAAFYGGFCGLMLVVVYVLLARDRRAAGEATTKRASAAAGEHR